MDEICCSWKSPSPLPAPAGPSPLLCLRDCDEKEQVQEEEWEAPAKPDDGRAGLRDKINKHFGTQLYF